MLIQRFERVLIQDFAQADVAEFNDRAFRLQGDRACFFGAPVGSVLDLAVDFKR